MFRFTTSFPKNFTAMIILLCAGVLARLMYGIYHPTMTITPDSAIYYDLASQLFTNPTINIVFNPFKSPLYGTLLHLLLRGLGYTSAPAMGSPQFFTSMQYVLFVQGGIGIAGNIMLYLLMLRLHMRRTLAFTISLLLGVNMMLIPWEHTLLTETLGTFLIIFLTWTFVSLLKKTQWSSGILFLLTAACGLLLRPAFLTVPLVYLVLLIFYRRNFKTMFMVTIISVVYLSVAGILIMFNIKNWNYKGLQITADINLLGKILQYTLPIESAKTQGYFYEIVTEYRTRGLDLHPYRLLDTYDPTIYINGEKLLKLRAFTTTVLTNNLLPYATRTISDVPKVFGDLDPIIAIKETAPLSVPMNMLQRFFLFFQKILIVIVVLVPIAIFPRTRNAEVADHTAISMGVVSLGQVVLTSALVYEEYGRLISVIIPIATLSMFYGLDKIFRSFMAPERH